MISRQTKTLITGCGAIPALATFFALGATGALIPSSDAHAAQGECRWEGGSGASGGYAYCAAEDCIGNGGLAQCSAGEGKGDPPFEWQQAGPGGWVYSMCDEHFSSTTWRIRWCTAAGGEWSSTECLNLPPDILGGGGKITNDESRAVSISDAFIGGHCGEPADTGWGATISSNWCWSGSTEKQLDIATRELRRRVYETGAECSATETITLARNREAECPPGYEGRDAVTGPECYVPAECSQTCVGNPVSIVTGTKFQREDDYAVAAETGIQLSRYYKSTGYYWPHDLVTLNPTGTFTAADVWRHTYDRRLYVVTGNAEVSAVLQRADGSLQVFDTTGAELTNRTSSGARIDAVAGAGWDVTRADGDVERYDTAGRLVSITTRAGRVTTLAYAGDRLATVTGPFGHTLTFAYDEDDLLATVTLPDAGVIAYAYDDADRLAAVTYADGTTREYRYESPMHDFLLTAIVDESGEVFATYEYDGEGRVVSESHAGGVEAYSFAYGGLGQPTSVTDPLGTTTEFGTAAVAGMYRPASHSQPCMACGPWAETTYDADGNPATRTDYNGEQTVYSYDPVRNLELSRTEAHGTPRERTITTAWHPTFRLPTLISEAGRERSYRYDGAGNLLSLTVTDTATSASRTWTYAYNGLGQVVTIDGPRAGVSDITSLTYASCTTGGGCGQVATITDAAGRQTSFLSHDAHGLPLTVSDANGTVTTLAYDARQRLVASTVGTEATTVEYWPTGLVKKLTFPDATHLSYTYDAARRLTGIADAAGNRIGYTLDGAGHRVAEAVYDAADTLVLSRTRAFDALGRLEETVGSQGQTVSYSYDGNGNPTSSMDPMGRVERYAYDELGRLTGITDPTLRLTALGYDAADRLVSVVDPKGLTTSYAYNGLGDALQLTSPDTGVSTFVPDAAGNLALATDARGETAAHTYDALGRLVEVEHDDQTIQYLYDQGVNGAGRLTGLTDGAGTTAWTHDAHGRVVRREQTVDTVELDVAYAYDGAGRLASLTTPSGQVVAYSYTNGRVSGITVNGAGLVSQVGYVPFGPTRGWQWGNGSTTVREYDTDGRLTYLSSAGASAFTYFPDGNRKSRTDVLEVSPPVTTGATTFSIAPASNRVLSAAGLEARSYSYDAAGNTLADGARSFAYDASGRMVSATSGGTTTSYAHNGLGERVRKQNAGGSVYFAYDEAGHLIGEYDAGGGLIQETVWLGDIPVATLRPDGSGGVEVYYVHTDPLNTPRRVTRPADDAIVWRWDSGPFGATQADADPDGDGVELAYHLRFPGQYLDVETGLHYNRFRDYDPVTGRYVESDPIGLNGGINAYAYAAGNPVAHIDPLGLFFTSVDAACAQDPWFCAEIIGDMRETPRNLAHRYGVCMPEDEGWLTSPEARVVAGVAAAAAATVAGVLQLRRGKVPKALPAPSHVPNAGGHIVSDVTTSDQTFYRVFSGDSTTGGFLTRVPPASRAQAVEGLALPPANMAEFIQQVTVPAGTRLQRSRALPAFGRRGGREQFELLDRIPGESFGPGVPLQ